MLNKYYDAVILRYLQDAIAAERNSETQLKVFSRDSEQALLRNVFAEHALQARYQIERLTSRLQALGGSASSMKGLFAHVFNFSPKTTPFGHESQEKNTQNLIVAFAIVNGEIAMYEELAVAATFSDDIPTERLARIIQEEERASARRILSLINNCCRQSFSTAASNRGNVA